MASALPPWVEKFALNVADYWPFVFAGGFLFVIIVWVLRQCRSVAGINSPRNGFRVLHNEIFHEEDEEPQVIVIRPPPSSAKAFLSIKSSYSAPASLRSSPQECHEISESRGEHMEPKDPRQFSAAVIRATYERLCREENERSRAVQPSGYTNTSNWRSLPTITPLDESYWNIENESTDPSVRMATISSYVCESSSSALSSAAELTEDAFVSSFYSGSERTQILLESQDVPINYEDEVNLEDMNLCLDSENNSKHK